MRVFVSLLLIAGVAAAQPPKPLDIYVVDVEGGNATLFVTPAGESILIDTGNAGGTTGRDPGRILEAIKDAGLKQIEVYTVPGMFIANTIDTPEQAMPVAPFVAPPRGAGGTPNPAPVHNGAAFWIKISAQQDGSFTVTNTRNSFSKKYVTKN